MMDKNRTKGFTLIEMTAFIGIFALVMLIVFSIFISTMRSYAKITATKEVMISLRRCLEFMSYEIKEAYSIYTPTSDPSQLSLETPKYSDSGSSSYIDFFLCGSQVCFKREGLDPLAITSDSVEISGLEFEIVSASSTPSVRIMLSGAYKGASAITGAPAQAATAVSMRSH